MENALNCFPNRLKQIRENTGLTQEQLANKIKLPCNIICALENGELIPDMGLLHLILHGLPNGISLKELLGDDYEKFINANMSKEFSELDDTRTVDKQNINGDIDCFPKRLKEIRENMGLTQTQLADALKVSRGAISYYEKGERCPDIAFLNALVSYSKLPVEYVLGYTDNKEVGCVNMVEQFGLSDNACKILTQNKDMGIIISNILEHEDFKCLEELYENLMKNHLIYNDYRIGYIGFLITDILNQLIFRSLNKLCLEHYSTDDYTKAIRKSIEKYKEQDKAFFDDILFRNAVIHAADTRYFSGHTATNFDYDSL